MAKFTYHAPVTMSECLGMLRDNPGAKLLAGGTDLMVKIRDKLIQPDVVIDIKSLDELKGISMDDEGNIRIGALETHTEISESKLILKKYPFFAQACRWVGSMQIRNRGTIGGNICNGSPAGETLPSLYILNAKVHLRNDSGKRVLPISDFYCGPQKTCAYKDEIVTSIHIPAIKGKYKGAYRRQGRRNAVSIAMTTAAAMWREDDSTPTGKRFSIALGSVAPTVIMAKNAEEFLNGAASCSNEILEKAAMVALEDASPINDIRTTSDYRNELVYVLVKRCLKDIICNKGVE
ncbi:MAG: xanthine dehydrogenase family protein subunit M [Candidatus Eremiobacteraeota bacterium]|nr:xanthine dehydrogenase family protein subunit M [Candidatus Eremiobacteraeota bacterium]